MATHKVTLAVEILMDEMDGTAEQSVEIALNLVEEAIALHWTTEAKISVTGYATL